VVDRDGTRKQGGTRAFDFRSLLKEEKGKMRALSAWASGCSTQQTPLKLGFPRCRFNVGTGNLSRQTNRDN